VNRRQMTFQERITEAQKDLNWLSEKALQSVFKNGPYDPTREIQERGVRIHALLISIPQVLKVQQEEVNRQAIIIDDLRSDILDAILNIRQFFVTIKQTPSCPPDVIQVLDEQLAAIDAAIEERRKTVPSEDPNAVL